MTMRRPAPPRSAAQQQALTARAEKGKRLLKRGLAAFKSQWMGVDPETGELGEVAFSNLKKAWDGKPASSRRRLGLVDNTLALGTLPSELAPMFAEIAGGDLLRGLNPFPFTVNRTADAGVPPSVEELARGSDLANAYSEAEPEGTQDQLRELVEFAPPQWAEEAANRAGRARTLANQSLGLSDLPEDLADAGVDAGATMLAQLPVPAAWMRRLRGIRAAAESKTVPEALRSVLSAPAEYLSPTINPTVSNYAAGTAFGTISNYLGAEQGPDPDAEEAGYAAGGTVDVAGLLAAANRTRQSLGLAPVSTLAELRDSSFERVSTPQPFGSAPPRNNNLMFLNPPSGTERSQTVPTGFVPQPNQIPTNPQPAQLSDDLPLGNDVMQPMNAIDVGSGEVTPVGLNGLPGPAAYGNPQFMQPLQRGQAPPRPAPVNLQTQNAGIYGPRSGSTAPPRRISDPSDPQWWLTYGFGPEQNFYSSNTLPNSGVPGGG